MKILLDHQKFSMQRYGGITKYFCELMERIPNEHKYELSVLFSDNYYLEKAYSFYKKPNVVPNQNFVGKNFIRRQISEINKAYSKYCIKYGEYDLLHPTYYDDYFLEPLKKPYIITVHDLIHFKFKDTYFKEHSVRDQMERVIRKASRIIAISEHTKTDICETIDINPDKIDVIYHGYNQTEKTGPTNNHWGEYILYVGERYSYKNFGFFINSVQPLIKNNRELRVICVGPSLSKEEKVLMEDLGISNQVIAMNVDSKTLSELYRHARVFVYPSLYEGFGLPILEAFANNCPVCLSDASCFPEVAGNAGCYFDPTDKDSILFSIEKIINNSSLSDEMRKLGKERVKFFSWETTVKKTMYAYEKSV